MTEKLTAAEIAEARELIAGLEDGPWFTCGDLTVYGPNNQDIAKCAGPGTAAFIAASRTGWPAALDALEEAGRALANLLRELNGEAHLTVEAVDRAEKAESSLAASDAARVRAEGERDEARRMYCTHASEAACVLGLSHPTPRCIAEVNWPAAADSLFPPDEEVK